MPHLLDTQYRMHPDIAAFPSMQFYDGLVKSGVSPDSRRGMVYRLAACELVAKCRPMGTSETLLVAAGCFLGS